MNKSIVLVLGIVLLLSTVSAITWRHDGTDMMRLDDYGSLNVVGNMTSSYFIGDGSLLTNINTSSLNLSETNYWTKNGTDLTYVDGNVGIGTTDPTFPLDVVGSMRSSSTVFGSQFKGGVGTSSSNTFSYSNNGNIGMFFPGATDLGFSTNGTEQMRIDSSGNVGIGTGSPSDKLDITSVSDTAYASLGLVSSVGFRKYDTGDGLYSLIHLRQKNAGDVQFGALGDGTTNRANFIVRVDNDGGVVEGLRVQYDGNVGIGTTTPQNKLNVVGDGNFTGNIYSNGQLVGAGAVTGEGTSGYLSRWNGTQSLNNSPVFTDGVNVGIGTTSPAGKLHVNGTAVSTPLLELDNSDVGGVAPSLLIKGTGSASSALISLSRTNVGRTSGVTYQTSLSDNWFSGIYYNGGSAQNNFGIGTDRFVANQKLVIDTSGNVGIGTASPSATLDVVGSINATGEICSGDNCIGDIVSGGTLAGDSELLDGYDSSFFMPLNTSVVGDFDFNGGWTEEGLSIIGGNIYAQTGYFYNISSLAVSNLNINGSLLPQEGFDNQFDLGSASLQWNDLYLGGNVVVDTDTFYVDSSGDKVGIGTASPAGILDVQDGTGTQTAGDLMVDGTSHVVYVGQLDSVTGNTQFNVRDRLGTTKFNIDPAGDGYVYFDNFGTGYGIGIQDTTPEGLFEIAEDGSGGDLFLVSSTENADGDLMIIKDGGNVGIGTSSPDDKLEIEGTSEPGIRLFETGGSNKYEWETDGSASWIGDLSNSVKNVYLTAGGGAQIRSNGDLIAFEVENTAPANSLIVKATTGNVGLGTQTPSSLFTTNTVAGTNEINLSGIVYVNSTSGNVGIGTSTPSYKLDVTGNVNAYDVMINGSSVATSSELGDYATLSYLTLAHYNKTEVQVINTSMKNYVDYTNSTMANYVDNSGFLTSYTETDPFWTGNYSAYNSTWTTTDAEIWNVAGNGTLMFASDWNSTNTSYVPYTGATSNLVLGDNNFSIGGTDLFVDNVGGNVGIGTASPEGRLDVLTTSDNKYVTFRADNGEQRFRFYVGASGNSANLVIYPHDGTTEGVRLASTGNSYFNGGNVGINTTTPQNTLNVIGTLNITNSTGNPVLITNEAGNVGIGTTSPDDKLHIYDGNLRIDGTNAYGIRFMRGGSTKGLINTNGNDLTIAAQGNADVLIIDDSDNGIIVKDGGNVGIGTITPQNPLNVIGTSNFSGSVLMEGTNALSFDSIGSEYINSPTAGNLDFVARGIMKFYAETNTNEADTTPMFEFHTSDAVGAGTAKMVILDNGKVGINTTTPQNTLNVIGDGNFTGSLYSNGAAVLTSISDVWVNESGDTMTGNLIMGGTAANVQLGSNYLSGDGDDEGITVSSVGRVGVGLAVTNEDELSITGDEATLRLQSTGSNGIMEGRWILAESSSDWDYSSVNYGVSMYYNGSSNYYHMETADNTDYHKIMSGPRTGAHLSFFPEDGDPLYIDATNTRVGIGTTSPNEELDVRGAIQGQQIIANGTGTRPTGIGSYIELYMLGETARILPFDGSNYKDLAIGDWNGGDPNIMLKVGGNVGIGEGSPSSLFTTGISSGTNEVNLSGVVYVNSSSGNVGIGTTSPSFSSNAKGIDITGTAGRVGNPQDGTEKIPTLRITDTVTDYGSYTATVGEIRGGVEFYSSETSLDLPGITSAMRNINEDTVNTQHGLAFYTYKDVAFGGAGFTEKLRIAGDGNVGIGTITPQNELNVIGDGNFTGDLFSQGINLTALNSSGLIINWSSEIDLSGYVPYTGATSNLVLGDNNFSIGGTDLFVDNVGGNVGIGTASPDETLHIIGELRVQSADYSGMMILGADKGTTTVTDDVDKQARIVGVTYSNDYNMAMFSLQSTVSADEMIIGSKMGNAAVAPEIISFHTTPVRGDSSETLERMRIASDGDVGIGTTTPQNKLNVIGDGNFSGYVMSQGINLTALNSSGLIINWSSEIDLSGYVPYTGATSNLVLGDNNFSVGGTDLFVDNVGGNVGIGTASPSTILHLEDASSPTLTVKDTTNNVISVVNAIDNRGQFGLSSDHDLEFITNGVGRMRIENGGNVGIGTTDPGAKLNVMETSAGATTRPLMIQNPKSSDNTGVGISFSLNSGNGIFASIDAVRPNLPTGGDTDLIFNTYNSGFSEKMRIKSNGFVGIGTASPSTKLHVAGNVNAYDVLINGSSVLTSSDLGDYATLSYLTSAHYNKTEVQAINTSMKNYVDYTNSTMANYVDNSGFLTSYTETDPFWTGNYSAYNSTWTTTDAEIWNVAGNGTLMFASDWNSTNTSYVPYTGAISNLVLGDNNFSVGGSDLFVDNENGYVGIGIADPLAPLTIKTGSGYNRAMKIGPDASSDGDGSYIEFTASSVDTYGSRIGGKRVGAGAYAELVFETGLTSGVTERMRIDYEGNVGIGTTSPNVNLHIKEDTNGELYALKLENAQFGVGDAIGQHFALGSISKGGILFERAGTYGRGTFHILQNSAANSSNVSLSDSVMTIKGLGEVGIGTTTPQNTLNVDGDGNFTGNLYSNGNLVGGSMNSTAWNRTGTNVSLANPGDNVSASTLFVDNSFDRVGIGTTSPQKTLEVNGTALIGGNIHTTGAFIAIQDQTYTSNNGDPVIYFESTASQKSLMYDKYSAPYTDTTAFIFDDSLAVTGDGYYTGNVGIGTTSPDGSLHLSSADQAELIINQRTTTNGDEARIRFSTSTTEDFASAGIAGIRKDAGAGRGHLAFYTNPTGDGAWNNMVERMRIDSSGNVGIGTTNPLSNFHIYQDSPTANQVLFRIGTSDDASRFSVDEDGDTIIDKNVFANAYYSSQGESTDYYLDPANTGNSLLVAGKVGIGTASPNEELDVRGAVQAQQIIANGTGTHPTGIGSYIELYMNGETARILPYDGSSYKDLAMGDWNGGNPNIMLKVGGNVGIGTGSPSEALDVNGSIFVEGTNSISFSNSGENIFSSNAGYLDFESRGRFNFYIDTNDGDASTSNEFNIYDVNNSNSLFTVRKDGKVGIGTTSPSSLLTTGISSGTNEINLSGVVYVNSTSGNVGIGTVTPSYKLDVVGTINAYDVLVNGTAISASSLGAVSGSGTAWRIPMWNGTTSLNNSNIYQSANGNIGIGITTPGDLLHIDGAIPKIRLRDNDASGTPLAYIDGSDGLLRLQADAGNETASSYLTLEVDASEALRVISGGNVGIGTVSPSSLLTTNTVAGTNEINLSGVVYVNSTSGRVGIGTASPSQALHVVGKGYFTTGINIDDDQFYSISGENIMTYSTGNNVLQIGDLGGVPFDTAFLWDGGEIMRVSEEGLGIGTETPQNALNVIGDGNFTGNIYSNGAQLGVGTVGGSGTYGYIPMWNSTSSINNSAIYQDGNGNVGIGTASPGNKLEVSGGDIRMQSGTSLIHDDTTGIVLGLEGGEDTFGLYWDTSVNSYDFRWGGSPKFTIELDTGRVDIPGGKLGLANIKTSAATEDYPTIYGTDNGGASYPFTGVAGNLVLDPRDGRDLVMLGSSDTVRMVVQGGGNVGIGTTTPQNTLNVVGDGNFTGYVMSQGINLTALNSSGLIVNWSEEIDLSGYVPYTGSSANVVLGDNNFSVGTSDLFVDGDGGNVGIGTGNPNTTLHVMASAGSGVRENITKFSVSDASNSYVQIQSSSSVNGAFLPTIVGQNGDDARYGLKFSGRVDDTTYSGDYYPALIFEGIDRDDNSYLNNVPVVSFTSEHLAVLTSWHDGMTKIGGTEEIDSAGGGVIKPTTMLDVIGGGSQDLLNLSDAGVTRVYVEEGGDVGIGTASPDANLDVEGVGPVIRVSAITDAAEEAELKLSWGSSDNHGLHLLYHANSAVSFIDTTYPTADASAFGDLAFRSWNGTTQIENMRIDGYTGNVGIGTSSPSSLLTTNTVAGTNEINLSGVVYVNSTSGSVGIGTTSPTDKLSIYDGRVNIREMTASSYAVLEFGNDAAALRGGFFLAGSTATGYGGAESMNLINLGSGPVALGTNNGVDMFIEDGGNIGIGTTTPQNKLNVVGDGNFTGYVMSQGINLTALNASGLIINWSSELGLSDYVPYTGASSNLVLGDNNFSVGASDLFVDNVGGNVGIGTATPDSLLEMEGENAYLHLDGSNAGTIIDRGSTGDLAYTFFQTAGVDKWRVGLSNEHEADLVFNEGPSNDNVRLMIEAGGNVGIGITDPQNELHVVGDGNFSGYVMSQGINLTALNASGLIINWSNQIDLSGYVPYTGATSNLVLGDNNFSVGTSDLFVDNVGGRVGIGTTTPTSLFTTNTLAGTNEINLSGLFYLNSTSGRVGIGTSNPVVRLNIQSPADANQMILGSATGVTQGITAFDGSEFGMYFGVANTGKSWIQGGRTNTATAYDISLQASGGDVGIGTINPDEKLHVQEDTNGEAYILKLENSQFGVGDAVGQHFGLGSAAKSGILFERTSSYGRGNLHFLQNILADTSNANLTNSVMTITGDGKVGVGTTEPQNEFEVIGDGNFTGNVTVGDCIVFANGGKICSA